MAEVAVEAAARAEAGRRWPYEEQRRERDRFRQGAAWQAAQVQPVDHDAVNPGAVYDPVSDRFDLAPDHPRYLATRAADDVQPAPEADEREALRCVRRGCSRPVRSFARDYYDDEGGYTAVMVCVEHGSSAEPATTADVVDYLRARRSCPVAEQITTPEALVEDMVVRDRFGDIGVVKGGHVHFPETMPQNPQRAVRKYGPLTVLWPTEVAPEADEREFSWHEANGPVIDDERYMPVTIARGLARRSQPAPRTVTAEEVEAATAMLWPTYITVEDDVPRAAHRLGQALAALGITVEVPRGE